MWPAVGRKVERSHVLKTFERTCWWPDACVYLTTLSHFPSHFVTWAGRPVPQQQLWPPRVSTLKDLIGLQVEVRSFLKDLQDHHQQSIQIFKLQHCFRSLNYQLWEEKVVRIDANINSIISSLNVHIIFASGGVRRSMSCRKIKLI